MDKIWSVVDLSVYSQGRLSLQPRICFLQTTFTFEPWKLVETMLNELWSNLIFNVKWYMKCFICWTADLKFLMIPVISKIAKLLAPHALLTRDIHYRQFQLCWTTCFKDSDTWNKQDLIAHVDTNLNYFWGHSKGLHSNLYLKTKSFVKCWIPLEKPKNICINMFFSCIRILSPWGNGQHTRIIYKAQLL